MNLRTLIFVAFVLPCVGFTQVTPFSIDSYSLEYPTNWTHKIQLGADGNNLHMFMGPEVKGSIAYCHTSEQPLQPTISARMRRMNDQQRTAFFATADEKLIFSLYSNLPSAQGFRLVYAGPAVLGKMTPAFTSDFFFRIPQGIVYRVRSHYTFWKTAQLSIWCQAAAKTEESADIGFLNNLSSFQRLIASVKIKQ